MRVNLAVLLFSWLAIELGSGDGGYVTKQILPGARADESAAEALAAELRRQGHRCEGPVNAERDSERSRPDEAVWVMKCTNATYRMRLIPNQAAHVEKI
jgi:hypothetical protein